VIHQIGTQRIEQKIIRFQEIYVTNLLLISGSQVLSCLENGVSQWPKLEGRFPQVSGIKFKFDGQKSPGSRICHDLVKIGDENLDLGDPPIFF